MGDFLRRPPDFSVVFCMFNGSRDKVDMVKLYQKTIEGFYRAHAEDEDARGA